MAFTTTVRWQIKMHQVFALLTSADSHALLHPSQTRRSPTRVGTASRRHSPHLWATAQALLGRTYGTAVVAASHRKRRQERIRDRANTSDLGSKWTLRSQGLVTCLPTLSRLVYGRALGETSTVDHSSALFHPMHHHICNHGKAVCRRCRQDLVRTSRSLRPNLDCHPRSWALHRSQPSKTVVIEHLAGKSTSRLRLQSTHAFDARLRRLTHLKPRATKQRANSGRSRQQLLENIVSHLRGILDPILDQKQRLTPGMAQQITTTAHRGTLLSRPSALLPTVAMQVQTKPATMPWEDPA